MSFTSKTTQQKFPFPYDAVFDGIKQVLPTAGMSLKSADKVIGRISASAGMSLFSWGENIAIIVESLGDSSTLVAIESDLKVGINLAGVHRHQKNFERLISALSQHLQRQVA